MKNIIAILIIIALTACNSTKKVGNQSLYQKLDYKQIDEQYDSFSQKKILVSNKEGIQLKKGAVILLITSDRKLGKMEIVSVNPDENYKITFNYTIYNNDGSIISSKDNYGLRGTWVYDFDKESDEATSSDKDIWNSREDDFTTYLYAENEVNMYLIPQ